METLFYLMIGAGVSAAWGAFTKNHRRADWFIRVFLILVWPAAVMFLATLALLSVTMEATE